MSLQEAISSVFSKYADFNGRARRSEYWLFCLFNLMIYAGISILLPFAFRLGFLMIGLYSLYSLVVFIPGLAVACRRLHDINRPGSYLLFVFIPLVGAIFLLIWLLQDSDPGSNRYGPSPKESAYYAAPVRGGHSPRPDDTQPATSFDSLTTPLERSSLYLQGAAGYHLGRRYPIRGTMVAGRDPGCAITFPADSHGVSHRHCQFRANGSSVIVTDLGSSYGTYINGRNRLKPNYPITLSAGDTVSLGSQKQCFTIVQK